MSSQHSVPEPEEKRLLTLNILRDVSVRISKMSENDLVQQHTNAKILNSRTTSNCLKNNVTKEIAIEKNVSLTLNPCTFVTGNGVDNLLSGDGYTNSVEYNTIDKKESYANQFTPEKITLGAIECDLDVMDSPTTKDFKAIASNVKDLNLIPGDIDSYENSMHTDKQCTTPIEINPPSNQTCSITKTTQSILTCQIASPDSVDPIIGWSPSSQQNINDPRNSGTGGWKKAKTVIQVKSQSACCNSANSTRSSMHNENIPSLSAKYQCNLATNDIEYELHQPSFNASSTESNDSDCVVEYIGKDECISTNEPFVSTQKAKLVASDINKMYALKGSKKITNKRSLKTNSTFYRQKKINDKLNIEMSTAECVQNKRDMHILPSDAEGVSDDDVSTSENEDVIDADEMKTLMSKLRRSSRVARPVYDPFIDKQVSMSLKLS